MKTNKQKLGNLGEEKAVEFLKRKGYKILQRNFQYGHHELDIVCSDGNDLVIVEVKSVRVPAFGSGESRISVKKQRSVIKATYGYLNRFKNNTERGVRFDVICVNLDHYPAEIVHYKSAFWQSR
jgi:putative endonuclease